MHPTEFEPTFPEGQRPHPHALYHADAAIGMSPLIRVEILKQEEKL
jgi:hypothetical protein